MIEILVVVLLGQKLGKKAQSRGLSKNYGWLILPFWLVPEFLGAFVAAFLGADQLVTYLAALTAAGIGAALAFVVVGNMGSAAAMMPAANHTPFPANYAPTAPATYAPTAQQGYAPAPPAAARPTAGYCSMCRENVWLAPTGGCARGHGPECISGQYTPSA